MKSVPLNLRTPKGKKGHSDFSVPALEVVEKYPPAEVPTPAGPGALGGLAALIAQKTREMIDSGALVVVDGVVVVGDEKVTP